MHRLFVALRPPKAIRDLLLATMSDIANARWQTDDQLHVTLRFIGEVDRPRADDIAAALGSVRHPRFHLAIQGVGESDRRQGGATVWAGVTPYEAVHDLHRKIDRALVGIGIASDGRRFQPHITLARLPRLAGPTEMMLEANAALASVPFPVDDFQLFESNLGNAGASYETIVRYSLT